MPTAQVALSVPELTPLVRSPRLPMCIQQLQTWMETEQARRERFSMRRSNSQHYKRCWRAGKVL